MNNNPNNMVHYRIKSTAKTPPKSSVDIMFPIMSTTAVIFSAISAAASVLLFKRIKRRR